ncbi:amidase [Allopusillimonas ginsengisoli]|uniref:amidase n=1 Tax=Allopusillimonas ginsengisoli TaxID=453575 RepID=UPI001431FC1F|nr:amidase [Allopusillimonas ginsengisoli]
MQGFLHHTETATEVAGRVGEKLIKRDASVHAFRDFDLGRLLAGAKELDRRPHSLRGPLHGLIIAVKEVFDVEQLRCTWGLSALHGRVPTEDANIVIKLKQLGALVAGTTISTELAIARAGPTRNPLNFELTPGGSSSGSAAAVAAGIVPIAIGSQTIGSIVRPAAFCGVIGFKPTRQLLNTGGMMSLAPPLDHVGLIGSNIRDLHFVVHYLADIPYIPLPENNSRVSKVLLTTPDTRYPLEPAMAVALQSFVQRLTHMSICVSQLRLPLTFSAAFLLAQTIVAYNIARSHCDLLERHKDSVSCQLLSLLKRGQQISDIEYQMAVEKCEAVTREIGRQMDDETIIVSPATDGLIPQWHRDHTGSPLYQALWTITGMPVISMPISRTKGLPLSVQLIAAQHCDPILLTFANRIEAIVRA